MGVHLRANTANRELQSVAQHSSKFVMQYFHWLLAFWDA